MNNGRVILSISISADIDMSRYVAGHLLGQERASDIAWRMQYEY